MSIIELNVRLFISLIINYESANEAKMADGVRKFTQFRQPLKDITLVCEFEGGSPIDIIMSKAPLFL